MTTTTHRRTKENIMHSSIPTGPRSCEWDAFDGIHEANGDDWEICIDARVAADAKWGVRGSLKRSWEVAFYPDSTGDATRLTTKGVSANLTAAKVDALAALRNLAAN